MKYLIGFLLIAFGLLHGVHAFGIEPGSVTNLDGGRFLSFASLDRLASAGWEGKCVVLFFDALWVGLGFFEIFSKRSQK